MHGSSCDDARTMPSAEFATYLKSEDARWSKVIVESKIKAD